MEYIQCPHCNKKYGVNDKMRAASGRTITCKNCDKAFEIILFETPTASTPETNKVTAKEQAEASEPKESKEKISSHKQRRETRNKASVEVNHKRKLSPSMLLGVVIVTSSVYFFYHDRSVDIGQPFVATETPKPSTNASSSLKHEEEAPIKAAKIPVHQTLSEACKTVAAQGWVMNYTMMHGMPESNEYASMLDESLQNTAEIREKCGKVSIVQEVLASATEGVPPKWLESHVSALITLNKKAPHF